MIASPARTIDTTHESHYAFDQGFPTADTMSQSYNDADLNRAIQAYKFFYPTVSGAAIVRGNEAIGIIPNKVFGILDCGPDRLVFTANSDKAVRPVDARPRHWPAGRRARPGSPSCAQWM